jgi:hypothetical protein
MTALNTLNVYSCTFLAEDWLPESTCAQLRDLIANGSTLQRLPRGMAALETVHVEKCSRLAADWLPESSAARVHTVSACSSNMQRLPPAMGALNAVCVADCADLDDDWLPESSRASVTQLYAEETSIESVPDGMNTLQSQRLLRRSAAVWLTAPYRPANECVQHQPVAPAVRTREGSVELPLDVQQTASASGAASIHLDVSSL